MSEQPATPTNPDPIKTVCDNIVKRCTTKEEGVARLDSIIDRQLSKATGVLVFNGLVLAGLYQTRTSLPSWYGGVWVGVLLLAVVAFVWSSALVWKMLWVRWGNPADYVDADKEIEAVKALLVERSFTLKGALVISACGLLISVLLTVGAAIRNAYDTQTVSASVPPASR
jgi:hypothetical protein